MKTYNTTIKYIIPAIALAILFPITYIIRKQFIQSSAKRSQKAENVLNIGYLKDKLFEGATLDKKGKFKQATKLYRSMLKYEKAFSLIHTNLAKTLTKSKNYKEAETHIRRALALVPGDTANQIFLGIILRNVNKLSESVDVLKKVILKQPNHYDTNLELSRAYYELRMYEAALKYGLKADRLKPKNIYALLNVAYIYNQKGELDKAIDTYKKVIEIKPNLANAQYNMGYSLKIKGEMKTALQYISKAIELQPDYLDAHIARSQSNISLGNFEKGWDEYEWRWGLFGIDHKQYRNSMWDGSDIKGKTILLRTEQGLGDTLQFVRYAKILKEMGAKVICKVQKPLVTLLSSCPFIDKVVAALDDTEKHDSHAQLMSLPRILKTLPNTIPAEIPYLYAKPELVKKWQNKLEKDKNFKVGLCWHVDPIHEKTKSPWSLRSISLDQFKPLSTVKGVTFYSLQKFKDYEKDAKTPHGLPVTFFGPDFDEKHGAFMDSAAIIKNLDLVITVDTCIAHLAGALGKPVWMFLPVAPDCRWHLDRSDTSWYPTMKLFRQKKPQDWNHPIKMVATELQSLANKRKIS